MSLKTLHLFAGAGGGLLADLILGHEPVCAVEINPFCCEVLRERRDEGWFPGLQVYEQDVRMFDPSPWRGRVDCIAAGWPCVDISVAGRGAGIDGERSGLYFEVERMASEIRPRFLFLENSPAIVTRGLDKVLGSLTQIGYDAVWTTLSASDVGAPHRRERWWCLANSNGMGTGGDTRELVRQEGEEPREGLQRERTGDTSGHGCEARGRRVMANPNGKRQAFREEGHSRSKCRPRGNTSCGCCEGASNEEFRGQKPTWWTVEPNVGRVAPSVPTRVHRIEALGNAQVPIQAAAAWVILNRMRERDETIR